jgi:hypothetical protein
MVGGRFAFIDPRPCAIQPEPVMIDALDGPLIPSTPPQDVALLVEAVNLPTQGRAYRATLRGPCRVYPRGR